MIDSWTTYIFLAALTTAWMWLYLSSKEYRKEMWVLGLFAVVLMPWTAAVNEIGLQIAWLEPSLLRIGLLDMYFAFLLAGLAGVIFHGMFGRHYHKIHSGTTKKEAKEVAGPWLLQLALITIGFSWSTVLLSWMFQLPMANAAMLGAMLVSLYIVMARKDLLIDTILSSALTAFIVYICARIATAYTGLQINLLAVQTDAQLAHVPLDLVIWSFAIGLFFGPVYEFARHFELRSYARSTK